MMMSFQEPVTERRTDSGSVRTFDQMHNMAYFVAEEQDKPSGFHGEVRRTSQLNVRRVIRAPFERVDHESGAKEIEEVQIGMEITMIHPKRTATAYGAISLRGDQIDQLIKALQEVQVAKSLQKTA